MCHIKTKNRIFGKGPYIRITNTFYVFFPLLIWSSSDIVVFFFLLCFRLVEFSWELKYFYAHESLWWENGREIEKYKPKLNKREMKSKKAKIKWMKRGWSDSSKKVKKEKQKNPLSWKNVQNQFKRCEVDVLFFITKFHRKRKKRIHNMKLKDWRENNVNKIR